MRSGDKFEQEFALTSNIQKDFINLFHDKNPLHVDVQFAKSKGFEDAVMHGNILGGFLSFFIGECLPIKNVIIHSQEIKYSKPVYANDVLMFSAEISEYIESVRVIEFKFSFSKKASAVVVARGKIQIGII